MKTERIFCLLLLLTVLFAGCQTSVEENTTVGTVTKKAETTIVEPDDSPADLTPSFGERSETAETTETPPEEWEIKIEKLDLPMRTRSKNTVADIYEMVYDEASRVKGAMSLIGRKDEKYHMLREDAALPRRLPIDMGEPEIVYDSDALGDGEYDCRFFIRYNGENGAFLQITQEESVKKVICPYGDQTLPADYSLFTVNDTVGIIQEVDHSVTDGGKSRTVVFDDGICTFQIISSFSTEELLQVIANMNRPARKTTAGEAASGTLPEPFEPYPVEYHDCFVCTSEKYRFHYTADGLRLPLTVRVYDEGRAEVFDDNRLFPQPNGYTAVSCAENVCLYRGVGGKEFFYEQSPAAACIDLHYADHTSFYSVMINGFAGIAWYCEKEGQRLAVGIVFSDGAFDYALISFSGGVPAEELLEIAQGLKCGAQPEETFGQAPGVAFSKDGVEGYTASFSSFESVGVFCVSSHVETTSAGNKALIVQLSDVKTKNCSLGVGLDNEKCTALDCRLFLEKSAVSTDAQIIVMNMINDFLPVGCKITYDAQSDKLIFVKNAL